MSPSNAPISVNLKGGGGGGRDKGWRFDKGNQPTVGTFYYRQVPQTPSWIGSYKRPGYHSVTSCIALPWGCIAKDGAIVPARIHGHFIFTCAEI